MIDNRKSLLRVLVGIAATFALALSSQPASAEDGATLFKGTCGACHTIGQGPRVGPDLAGVTERRSEKWLLAFIKSSQTVINSGDPDAKALFEKFNKVPMPDMPWSDDKIRTVLAYIKSGGTGGAAAGGAEQPADLTPATPQDVERGRAIFQGLVSLQNGGPPCNSCHHVKNDAVIGGGVLAKDLTSVFSRVGGSGVGAILGTPPFPVMQRAYEGKAITPAEVKALVGFLRDADEKKALQQPKDYGMMLVGSGSAGLVGLLVLYGGLWMRRKKRSVNDDIYERQVRSS